MLPLAVCDGEHSVVVGRRPESADGRRARAGASRWPRVIAATAATQSATPAPKPRPSSAPKQRKSEKTLSPCSEANTVIEM